MKEKDRRLAEKDKHLSELRRKCTSLEIAKEKVEVDLQVARKLRVVTPPTSSSGGEELGEESHLPTKVLLAILFQPINLQCLYFQFLCVHYK